jgi:Fe-S oxidoreductase
VEARPVSHRTRTATSPSSCEQARTVKPDFIVCDSETCRWHIAAATGLPVYHPVQVLDRAYRT